MNLGKRRWKGIVEVNWMAVMLWVLGQIHGRHTSCADFPDYGIPARESGVQLRKRIGAHSGGGEGGQNGKGAAMVQINATAFRTLELEIWT